MSDIVRVSSFKMEDEPECLFPMRVSFNTPPLV